MELLQNPTSKSAALILALVMTMGCNVDPNKATKELGAVEIGTLGQAIAYDGHDYLFVNTPMPWQEAQAYCRSVGYSLVSINSASEESFLETREVNRGFYGGWWIGYTDQGAENLWYWANSSSTYTNWYPGEPNNGGGSGEQDCAVDYYHSDGRWGDESCDAFRPFVCERSATTTKKEGSFTYTKSNTYSATENTANRSVYLYAGQLFTVGTCGVYTSTGTGDTYLRLNDPSGKEIAYNDDSCGYRSNISIVVPATGTYVIRAGCYDVESCSGTVAWTTDYY